MTLPRFQQTQFAFTSHLRDPENAAIPEGVEDRRMGVYRDLVYRNIENFLASGFPVLRAILEDHHWHGMIRDFIVRHRCRTPYFLEIGQEFLRYLQETREPETWEPPFLLELAHYEWVELAVDISTDEFPSHGVDRDFSLETVFQISPLAWRLSYQYPVHKISPDVLPSGPVAGGVNLVVYRNSRDEVKFLEVNQVVAALLQLIDSKPSRLGLLLEELAVTVGYSDRDAFSDFALSTVKRLVELNILFPACRM